MPTSDRLAAESRTGSTWPPDLHDWYAVADGASPGAAATVLPFHRPLPLAEVVSTWEVQQRIWASILPNDLLEQAQDMTAGTPSGAFLRAYVPIASDGAGNTLFVDTRDGPLYGSVGEFVEGDTDSRGPIWTSVGNLLDDLADGLTLHRPVGRWDANVVDGQLGWSPTAPTGP